MRRYIADNAADSRDVLMRLFAERERYATLFMYSITHSTAEVAIHDGFPFKRWPLNCTGVTEIRGIVSGGPYDLNVVEDGAQWTICWGDGAFVVKCESFSIGEFGLGRSPEAPGEMFGK